MLAAAAASLIRPIEVEQPLRAAWRIVTSEPRTVGLRLARGVALVAVGVLVIAQPWSMLRILATLVGVYALYKGLEAILRMLNGPPPPPARANDRGSGGGGSRSRASQSCWSPQRGRRVRHRWRHRRARGGDLAMQRACGVVRPRVRRSRAAGDPQLDVGPAARLVRVAAGAPDQRTSSRTASAACCWTPTTPTGWRTAGRARTSGARRRCSAQIAAGRREPGQRRGGAPAA